MLLFSLPVAAAPKPDDGAAALRDPARLVGIGDRAAAGGDLQTASGFYERALQIDPRYAPAARASALAALQLGSADMFAKVARWTSVAPTEPQAQLALADALLRSGRAADASAPLRRAAELGAPAGQVDEREALRLDLIGEPQRAQQHYARALAEYPGDPRITQRMALSLALSQDYAAALQLLRPLSSVPANDAMVRQTLALVYAAAGQVDTAVDILKTSVGESDAQMIRPVLARIASLPLPQRAEALHFNRIPARALAQPALPAAPMQPVAAPPSAAAEAASEPPSPIEAQAAAVVYDPARSALWVQLASTPDPRLLASEWRRLQQTAGPVLSGRVAYVQRATGRNRLLVGPFASERDAGALQRALAERRIEALVSRTPAGSDIVPLEPR